MSKLRKLALTAAALAALAVGGAAFAQAQNAAVVTKVPTHQGIGESPSSGDTDNVQAGDQSGPDQGAEAGSNESDAEQADGPESAVESDGPGGHHDEPAAAQGGQETQED
ncbi:MAG TPA: hypothetical protein VGC49_00515 [Solirubrobacterales bacterium]|jgi:hypothetical protein